MSKIISILFITFLSTTLSWAKIVELNLDSHYSKGEEITKQMKTKIVANTGNSFIVPANYGNPFEMKVTLDEVDDNTLHLSGFVKLKEDEHSQPIANYSIISEYGKWATFEMIKDDGSVFKVKVLPTKR